MLETELKKTNKLLEQVIDLMTAQVQQAQQQGATHHAANLGATPPPAVPAVPDQPTAVPAGIAPAGGGNGASPHNAAGAAPNITPGQGISQPPPNPAQAAAPQLAQPMTQQSPNPAAPAAGAPMTNMPAGNPAPSAAAPATQPAAAQPAAASPSNPVPQVNETYAPGAPQGSLNGDLMQRLSVIMHELGDPMAVFKLQKKYGLSAMSAATQEVSDAILAEAEALLVQKKGAVQ